MFFRELSAIDIFLAAAIIKPIVSSAADMMLAFGVFVTKIFFFVASDISILSIPTPQRAIIFKELALSINSLVMLVPLLTKRISASAIFSSINASY